MSPASRKRARPAKKTSAKSRKPKKAAKRATPRGRKSSAAGESDSSLVYSDIRRSMHGAILRSLR